MHNLKLKKGFTLIELLIVIALLGALAVGLLAAVDPFEQLKKGKDTSIRNTAAEFYNASIRYYAQRGQFPWLSITAGLTTVGQSAKMDTLSNVIDEMANAGELKKDFYNLAGSANLNSINVYWPASESIIVCVNPQSKAFRNDSNTKYDAYGANASACPNATSPNCYICFQ